MATGGTLVSDVIVPEVFDPYSQQVTTTKSTLINSGAAVIDPELSNLLNGGGLTFSLPSWAAIDETDANVATDAAADKYTGGSDDSVPSDHDADLEIAIRLTRNRSWGAGELARMLAGSDPMRSVGNQVGTYWMQEWQRAFVATATGVFADNAAAPAASEHVQNDMTFSLATANSSTYLDGVTNFSARAFIDAAITMGDNEEDLGIVMVHSVVYATMLKNNLIDFIPDSETRANIPYFLGRRVIKNDKMPNDTELYDTWLFGAGAFRIGVGQHKRPTSIGYEEDAGNGDGEEILYTRRVFAMHPTGHKYAGATTAKGGPSNAATSNNLGNAGSWQRVYPNRKQIKMARLITREA